MTSTGAGAFGKAATASSLDAVAQDLLVAPDIPVRGGSRVDDALVVDRELLRLAGMDAHVRRIQAHLTRRFMDLRAWRRLGFVRLSDYARERLGISSRALADDAHVMRRLDETPYILAAFNEGSINWTQARLLVRVATAANEKALLQKATTLSTRALEKFLQLRSTDASHDATNVADGTQNVPIPDDSEGHETIIRWNVSVSRTGRRMWRAACELASRSAGAPLSPADVLELVAAEASSGARRGNDAATATWMPSQELIELRLRELQRGLQRRTRSDELGAGADCRVVDGFPWLDKALADAGPAKRLETLLDDLDRADSFELDRRLRELKLAAQQIDSQVAALLRIGLDRRLFRELGFATVKLYVESRLGLSARKVWSILAIERSIWSTCPQLRDAWRDGRISHLAACALLPVISERHGDAWLRRASEVTLRRLTDEVTWALDQLDRSDRAGIFTKPAPPPLDAEVRIDGIGAVDVNEVQMRAHGAAGDRAALPSGSVPIEIHAPLSVAVLVETALWQLREGQEPRWRTFERMVALAMLEWTSTPKHRDPVFERDGWRCSVPGCSSRRNLHDHHVLYRSHGGSNARDNRITICASHHLHGIHAGIVRARGEAPSKIFWELGCSAGKAPIMRLLGDRVLA